MNGAGKWIVSTVTVFLMVFLIDFNCARSGARSIHGHSVMVVNLIVGSVTLLLLIFSKISQKR
ncbi:MAG: hypothetical protein BGO55_11605 [Sphingobacteriales bacterium 50-39]|nr:MAG: hypothetical protein BGO55_11605 [Sphingobacteriales bacterium 50-39]